MDTSERINITVGNEVDLFKRALDLITLAVVILGFGLGIYNAFELVDTTNLAKKAQQVSTWTAVSQTWLDMDKLFIEHSDARQYIYNSVDIAENEKNYDKILPIANSVLDFVDYAVGTYCGLRKGDPSLEENGIINFTAWEHYFKNQIFSKSPLICRLLKKDAQSYDPQTVRIANEACPI